MEKILYQDETQTLLELTELSGGGKRYEIDIIDPANPDPIKLKLFVSKKAQLPKMPIKCWDTITYPCCNFQYMWILDAKDCFWLRFGDDKWKKTDADYLIWLLEDIFKPHRNKVREVAGMEVEK